MAELEIIGECIYCGDPIRGTPVVTDRTLICILGTVPRVHLDPDDDIADTGW